MNFIYIKALTRGF